jgi:hypothetical protein
MAKIFVRALCVSMAAALVLSGCSTFRGAPTPLLKDSVVNGDTFVNAKEQMDALVVKTGLNESNRNAAVFQLMALVDVRYLQFRNDIVANRKHTRSVADAMTLATDIAATLTNSVGVKDNYIALSALIGGGQTIYDKDYLFDRTLEALVTQMDANRKAKQVLIYESLRDKSVMEYSGQSALADVLDYYYMGTINAAVSGVHKSAAQQQAVSEEQLRTIGAIDPARIEAIRQQTDRSGKFVDSLKTFSDQQLLAKFLRGQGVNVPDLSLVEKPAVVLKQRMNELRKHRQDKYADFDALLKELAAEGFKIEGI